MASVHDYAVVAVSFYTGAAAVLATVSPPSPHIVHDYMVAVDLDHDICGHHLGIGTSDPREDIGQQPRVLFVTGVGRPVEQDP